jgi:carboxypeptidase Taq
MTNESPYQKLLARAREIALIESASHLLSWDQETYMPPKALEFRADQGAYLSGWTHRLFTASEVGDWIKACEDHSYATASKEAANVREWRRTYDRATKLPTDLVEELERARTLARNAWVQARQQSSFPVFQPHLLRILELSRRMADHWGYEESRYDALLDEYEPGARASQLRPLFAGLRAAIVKLLPIASERASYLPKNFLEDDYPIAAQQAFNREVAEAIGFDFGGGRIDTTTHPFCTGLGPNDCRLTTRYNPRDFTQSLYGILHEAGHGLYDQGLVKEDYGTPAGSAASLGIHESQSRLWENHVGRSRDFWEHWHGAACRHFPGLERVSPQQITQAVNRVSPSFVRVEADEVTYDLHIVLRFELETKLIDGDLQVADVPAAWNENFEKIIGLKVPDDAHGCLQDIHWSLGSIGYFPTYTLGNLNASQLFRKAALDHPGLRDELKAGKYARLLGWLREKVHQQGHRHPPQKLMELATGEPAQSKYHLEYLQAKFAT